MYRIELATLEKVCEPIGDRARRDLTREERILPKVKVDSVLTVKAKLSGQ